MAFVSVWLVLLIIRYTPFVFRFMREKYHRWQEQKNNVLPFDEQRVARTPPHNVTVDTIRLAMRNLYGRRWGRKTRILLITGTTSTGTTIQSGIVSPATVINRSDISIGSHAESLFEDPRRPGGTVKWVYVTQPNVEVLPAIPAPVKRWKSFVAGMCSMLMISAAMVWGWQYFHRSDPLQAQLTASLTPLPAILTPEQLDILRQQSSLPQTLITQTQQQLALLDKLPPDWLITRERQLVEQAQSIWPERAKPLMQRWQQQLNVATLPTGNLNGWHQGMMTLQKLSERLNGLDEHKGKYMTVSELKSVVYSAMQLFNQSIPAEEQLRILAQSPVGQPLPPAAGAQAEMRLKQLIARYADIKQNASKLKGVNGYE
ncbi:VasL domain-containing protein [Escherichia ruysiae]|uniref:VasL domain-containing protein n=1 Tax=Escherichia ruysiae TaxID=2608867 RepID=UPI00257085BC|nr:VasL domain-containing protein [Escherichia ruysiae]